MKKINFAVVGTGKMAINHIKAIKKARNARVLAVRGSDIKMAKAFWKCNDEADKWALKKIFGSHLGYVVWRASKISIIRRRGVRVLDIFARF